MLNRTRKRQLEASVQGYAGYEPIRYEHLLTGLSRHTKSKDMSTIHEQVHEK
jgi:hypothetical protein